MANIDYDVLIISSGFGGSVAALRAAEKGYRVAVMEAGKCWKDDDIPKTNWDLEDYAWFPSAEMYGIQRIEYLDDMLILCDAGVGGGSHVYGNALDSREGATLTEVINRTARAHFTGATPIGDNTRSGRLAERAAEKRNAT